MGVINRGETKFGGGGGINKGALRWGGEVMFRGTKLKGGWCSLGNK